MKLLRTISDWETYINDCDFNNPDPEVLAAPKRFPCYVYEQIDSNEFEWTSPAFLYVNDLRKMFSDLMKKLDRKNP